MSDTFLTAADHELLGHVPKIIGYDKSENEVVRILIRGLPREHSLPMPMVEMVVRAAFRGGLYIHANQKPEIEVTHEMPQPNNVRARHRG